MGLGLISVSSGISGLIGVYRALPKVRMNAPKEIEALVSKAGGVLVKVDAAWYAKLLLLRHPPPLLHELYSCLLMDYAEWILPLALLALSYLRTSSFKEPLPSFSAILAPSTAALTSSLRRALRVMPSSAAMTLDFKLFL